MGVPLREQLLWRIEQLTSSQELNLSKHVAYFPELLERLTVPGLETWLDKSSVASLGDGGSLELNGFLVVPEPRRLAGYFERKLLFDANVALHGKFELVPEDRGAGICLRFLHGSFALYDELGLQEVQLRTGLASGSWYWAQVGFEFQPPGHEDRAALAKWARAVCEALGVEELNVEDYATAAGFARLGGVRKLSFEQLADAFPEKRDEFKALAMQNGLQMDERIEFGRAVMLSGPDWSAYLQLNGPSRVAFELALASKEERLAREQA